MVVHWLRRRERGYRRKLAYNALGAATTGAALIVIVSAKLTEGAWMTVVVVPAVVLLLHSIRRHYERLEEVLEEPFEPPPSKPPAIIVLVDAWNRVSEQALYLATLLSSDVTAAHVRTERDSQPDLQASWPEKMETLGLARGRAAPRLAVIDSPYRLLHQPILDFVEKAKRARPGQQIAVLFPELASPRWFENVLHNLRGAAFRMMLYGQQDDRVAVINVPWRLPERRRSRRAAGSK